MDTVKANIYTSHCSIQKLDYGYSSSYLKQSLSNNFHEVSGNLVIIAHAARYKFITINKYFDRSMEI